MLQHTLYHSVLRVTSLSLALVLLFDSGLISPITQQLSQNTQDYLASAIGISAGVEPTELNSMTAELARQKQDLDAREAALRDREMNIGLNNAGVVTNSQLSTWILSTILFILLVLIVLNYVMDFLRRQPILQTPEGRIVNS